MLQIPTSKQTIPTHDSLVDTIIYDDLQPTAEEIAMDLYYTKANRSSGRIKRSAVKCNDYVSNGAMDF